MYLKKCDFCGVTSENSDILQIPLQHIDIEDDETVHRIYLEHICKKCRSKMYDYMKSLITKEVLSLHEKHNRK